MTPFLRFIILMAAVAVALVPLLVVAQTKAPAKSWTPPKTRIHERIAASWN